ncbi:MAG: hypothetical protein LBC67_01320 [Spirochaetales bacterium]|jgi:hypothetical protein|nr:hypothetical protein [Spirochaetales bacterium]
MRKTAACVFLFLRVLCASAGEKDYYTILRGLPDERAVLDFISKEITSSGGAALSTDFSQFSGGHSFSRILETSVSGARPETLIIAAPSGAGEASFNAALALSLWRSARGPLPPVSLHFVFLGSDADRDEPLGTRLFLDSFFPEHPVSVLYLNFPGIPQRIVCETGARGIIVPSWLIRRVLASSKNTGLEFFIDAGRNQLYRLGRVSASTPAGEYLSAGFPAIALGGEPSPSEDYPSWQAAFEAFFTQYLESNSEGIPDEWDRHYLLFSSGNSVYILEEQFLLALLLIVLGASIFTPLFARRYVRKSFHTLLRNWWSLVLIFLLLFLFFLAGTFFVRSVPILRDFPRLWSHIPFLFFLLKISSAVFLTALFFRKARSLPLSKNGSFYSASAILVFFINILIFTGIDLAFMYYFLWAYAGAIVFSLFRNRFLKTLLLFIIPLLFYRLVYITFFQADTEFAGILINSIFTGNFLLTFMTFPFFLTLIRLDLLFRQKKKRSGFGLSVPIALGAAGLLVSSVFILVFNPYKNTPQPLSVEEYAEAPSASSSGVHELRLSSPSPLGRFRLSFGDRVFSVDTQERSCAIPLEPLGGFSPSPVSVEAFLSRRSYTIEFKPFFRPRKVRLSLSSGEPLGIYDSNFPYTFDASGKKAEIHIGVDPPSPLDIILTLPAALEAQAEISSRSPLLSESLEIQDKNFSLESYSQTRDLITIKSDVRSAGFLSR